MGVASISLIILASSLAITTAYIVLPIFNIHLTLNREALLKEKVQTIMLNHRLIPNQIKNKLPMIEEEIPGIDFTQIEVYERGQYIIAEITYKESKLFFNKFNEVEINKRRKTSNFIIDKVNL